MNQLTFFVGRVIGRGRVDCWQRRAPKEAKTQATRIRDHLGLGVRLLGMDDRHNVRLGRRSGVMRVNG